MKKYDEFINESDDEFRKFQNKMRKIVKDFVNRYIISRFNVCKVESAKATPWKEDTDVLLRISGMWNSKKTTNLFKTEMSNYIKKVEEVEKILGSLNIDLHEVEVAVTAGNSVDLNVTFQIKHSYFEDNKELLANLDASYDAIDKFDL